MPVKLFLIKINTSNNDGCWFCNGNGDPARTLKINNAKLFANQDECTKQMFRLKKMYPNREFEIDTINLK